MERFYLGSPEGSWLKRTTSPLFVSHLRLRRPKSLPRALGPWSLDSGGFTELNKNGEWTVTALSYALAWRQRVTDMLDMPLQRTLF